LDANINPNDTVLFYFSGHGVPGDDGEHYLSTSEIDPDIPRRRGLSFDELMKIRGDCNSKTVFTILDCCYSGVDKPSKGHEDDAAKLGKEIISVITASALTLYSSVAFLSSTPFLPLILEMVLRVINPSVGDAYTP